MVVFQTLMLSVVLIFNVPSWVNWQIERTKPAKQYRI